MISLPTSQPGDSGHRLPRRSYEVQWKLAYRRADKSTDPWSQSVTRSINSRTISFVTRHRYEPGDLLELVVAWPITQPENTGVELAVLGRVTECGHGHAIVSIQRYEFRRRSVFKAAQ